MMDFLRKAGIGLALTGLGGALAAVPAHAQGTIAYDNSGTGNQQWTGNLAMDFNVGSAGVFVTELGVFDDGATISTTTDTATLMPNGASPTTIEAAIYKAGTQTQVVGPETFTSGTQYTAVNSDIFQTLTTPMYLAPGNYTIDAVGYNATTEDGNKGVSNSATTQLNTGGGVITFVGTGQYDGSSTMDNPATIDGGPADRYAAGTFAFTVAPEPAQMAVYAFVALGLGGLMLRARKRQLAA